MFTDADDRLFAHVTGNSQHLLHDLLPPRHDQHYSLRQRTHNCLLPLRAYVLTDKNFLIRMLYKQSGCSPLTYCRPNNAYCSAVNKHPSIILLQAFVNQFIYEFCVSAFCHFLIKLFLIDLIYHGTYDSHAQ